MSKESKDNNNPEVREGPASEKPMGIKDSSPADMPGKESDVLTFSTIGIQTPQDARTFFEEDVISQVFTKLDAITKELAESEDKLEASNKQVLNLTKRVSYLETVTDDWNRNDGGGNQNVEFEELPEFANLDQGLADELAAQVLAEAEGRESLKDKEDGDGGGRGECNPLEQRISSGPMPSTGTSSHLGATGDYNMVQTQVANMVPPPGLTPQQQTPYGGKMPHVVGFGNGEALDI